MNRLEQKIYDAMKAELPDYMFSYYDMDVAAHIAAKICLEVAEKAYNVGSRDPEVEDTVSFEDFKKEIL